MIYFKRSIDIQVELNERMKEEFMLLETPIGLQNLNNVLKFE